ncbi:hypothetical protein RY972_10870 [Aeromonas allosaccharophila]|uniref:Uncharacterized protein n=1 Tax=Aeromonas allosaccharophila TaxID=656 RepID=A0ABZ0FGC0_9GAMM|nr:hypothetical protein [Aeromonas allosaccharophila]WOE68510.1 hypothetical protein RY972_10870 [Aeromonas allosaccharophila]
MKLWGYGALAVFVLLVSAPWVYKKWHVYQYCKMSSEQLVCTRVGEPGMTIPWCEGDFKVAMATRASNLRDGFQAFDEDYLKKQETLFQEALPKARELVYRKCVVESL